MTTTVREIVHILFLQRTGKKNVLVVCGQMFEVDQVRHRILEARKMNAPANCSTFPNFGTFTLAMYMCYCLSMQIRD